MADVRFYYDFNSPYSYLASTRVRDLLPEATWTPIAFGVLIRQLGKVPWSMREGREEGMAEIERRAAERGLPPVRWPEGWPVETYSLAPLRAALFAQDRGRLHELSDALYRRVFVDGASLADTEQVLAGAEDAGLDRDQVREAIDRREIKDRLRANTDAAIARGVTGVPTIAVGEELFWGDDRLEDAVSVARG
jgi:2-hydroxychromene-2-carboxylate isomerase